MQATQELLLATKAGSTYSANCNQKNEELTYEIDEFATYISSPCEKTGENVIN